MRPLRAERVCDWGDVRGAGTGLRWGRSGRWFVVRESVGVVVLMGGDCAAVAMGVSSGGVLALGRGGGKVGGVKVLCRANIPAVSWTMYVSNVKYTGMM